VDGVQPGAVSCVAAGEIGDRDFYRADYLCGRAEHFGGAVNDGDGQGAGHCSVAVDGDATGADSTNFSAGGIGDWGDGDGAGIVDRICVYMDCWSVSFNTAGPAGVRGAICAVSPEHSGWSVDRIGGNGNCVGGDDFAGARGVEVVASGDSEV